MASSSLQSQSQSQLWNKLPPEILGLILSNLRKHDLLNARMVSHAWNDESLKVLKKSKFSKLLSEWNIREYTVLTMPDEPSPFIIPFHLDFKINFSSGDLGLKALTSDVESLCKIFGPECVSRLTLANDTFPAEKNVKQIGIFLALISLGLKTLELGGFDSRIEFLQDKTPTITFPKLKKLICNTHQYESGRKSKGGSDEAYISIIRNSPNLEDLTLTDPCDLDYWPLNFNQLKSLSLGTMSKLYNILDKILASSGPLVLRELCFKDDLSSEIVEGIVVHNILEAVSSTLKSLRFRGPINFGILRVMRFPKLPHLEHLGLEYYLDNEYLPEDNNLNEETFPALKSIELPIGLKFTPSHVQSEENDVVIIQLPNLVKLILRVNGTFGPEHLNGALEHLQEIFPTPSKLSLVNVGGRRNDRIKYLLEFILKSNWSKNIQEFEMNGFYQDCLGEFLESVDDPGSIISTEANQLDCVKMTNLTTLKLELELLDPTFDIRSFKYSLSTALIPNLTGFMKHFPQLRTIEVSDRLFRQKDKIIRRRHMLEFQSEFPGVHLYVT